MTSQRGLTLVELMIAVSIMSLLLVGIGSVVFVAGNASGLWSQQITAGETLNQLSGALDQDLHRYTPCPSQRSPQELDLCLPRDQSVIVKYWLSGNDLVRTTSGANDIVARDLTVNSTFGFSLTCTGGNGNVDIGAVTVNDLLYPGQTTPSRLVVNYRAPSGGC